MCIRCTEIKEIVSLYLSPVLDKNTQSVYNTLSHVPFPQESDDWIHNL